MEVTNEQTEETTRLTVADLGVAAWATSELFNYMLEGYENEDYGEMTKEQVEQAMNKLRSSFIKFDALAKALTPKENE
jgi:chemotaxis protein CheY-P-specific phosphatase CheC